ncbi:MAG TPA: ABC transporter permease [Solirubrobacterales bacterium]|nr:ABC transporter permease [Solirubrobacterales bacterium]
MSAATVDAGTLPRPRRRGVWRRIKGWPMSIKVGVGIVGVLALAALLAPLVAPFGPNEIDPFALLQSPSGRHLFGTDDTGRDVFSRTLYGLRLDLGLCLLVTFVPLPFAIVVGALAGYFGGWLDMIVSRLADVMISFPFIVLVMAVVAIVGPGVKGFLIGVPLAAWALYARLARAEMLIVREQPYMLATTALGYSKWRAIFKHGLPNVARPCLVYSTIDLIGNLILLAGLSYLGFGVQPPTAELGGIIADGQGYLLTAWWISTLPGLVLVLLGVGIGLIGEGISDRGLERGGR